MVRGSGIGSRFDMSKMGGKRDAASEARCAELEAEAAYAAALVEEAQANVARYSGGMERLCSRIGTLRLMPTRSLACALAVEARNAQMEVLRLTEQNAVLHASLRAKHTAHGGPVAEVRSPGLGSADLANLSPCSWYITCLDASVATYVSMH
jgi:hypothetical protein